MWSNSSPIRFSKENEGSIVKFQKSKPLRRHSLAPTRGILKQRANEDQNHTIHIMPNGESRDILSKRRRVSFAPEVTLHKIHIDSGNKRNNNNYMRDSLSTNTSTINNTHRNFTGSPVRFDIQSIDKESRANGSKDQERVQNFEIYGESQLSQNDDTAQSMEITQMRHDNFDELFGEDNSDELDEETMELTGPLKALNSKSPQHQSKPLLFIPGGILRLTEDKPTGEPEITEVSQPDYEENDEEDEEQLMESTQKVTLGSAAQVPQLPQRDIQTQADLPSQVENEDKEDESVEMESTEQVRFNSHASNNTPEKEDAEEDIENLTEMESTQKFVISQSVVTSTQEVVEDMELTRPVIIAAPQRESSSQDDETSMELTQPVEAEKSGTTTTPERRAVTHTPPSSGANRKIHTLQNGSPQSASKLNDQAVLKFTPMKTGNLQTKLSDISDPSLESENTTTFNQTNDNSLAADESYVKTYTVTTTIPLGDEDDGEEEDAGVELYTLSEFLEEAKISFNDDIRPNRRSSIEQFKKLLANPPPVETDYISGIEQIPDLEYLEHAIREFERGLNNTKASLESFETQMESENPRIVQDFFAADVLLKISLQKSFQILKNRSRINASCDMRRVLLGWLENLGTKIARHGDVISNNIMQLQLEGREIAIHCHELKERKVKLKNRIQKLQKYQSGVYSADKNKIKSSREQLVSTIDKVLKLRELKSSTTESISSLMGSVAGLEEEKESLERERLELTMELQKNKLPSDELLLGLNKKFDMIQKISGICFESFDDNVLKLSCSKKSLIINYNLNSNDISESLKLEFNLSNSTSTQLLDSVKSDLLDMIKRKGTNEGQNDKMKACQIIKHVCQIWSSVIKIQHNLRVLKLHHQLNTFKIPGGIKVDLVLFKYQFKAIFSFVVDLDVLKSSDKLIKTYLKIESYTEGDGQALAVSESDALGILKNNHSDVLLINRLSLTM